MKLSRAKVKVNSGAPRSKISNMVVAGLSKTMVACQLELLNSRWGEVFRGK